ncbi:Gfo/Idh/MocA family protein [Paenibacillus sp. HJGM_3]|uniref:Gfo/Idh/MocA family protein n=1 Tax=Paenibacillus sp. HJGM_3 TaxID=3379816 RepID=UPI00385CEC22
MTQPIRLGMIGSGHVSNRYFEQAARLDGVRFVATCARSLDSARLKAEQVGVPRWYDDYRVMMDAEELDGVVVATPHSVHAEPALAAFERGLHVMNEKPMATSFEECRRMVEQAEAAGVVFMSLPYDMHPSLLTAASYVDERYLGKITGAESQLSLPGPWRDNWYYDRSVSHGGAVLDCLVYAVSRLVALLGPAVSVMAEAGTLIPRRIVGDGKRVLSDVDDNVTVLLGFAGGQQAVLRTLWGLSFKLNNTLIYGRKGTLAWNDSGFPVVLHSPGQPIPGAEPVRWRGLADCYAPTAQLASAQQESPIAHFVRCMRSGVQPVQSARQQLHVHEIMFAAYRSAETGKRVALTTTFVHGDKLDPAIFDTKSGYI